MNHRHAELVSASTTELFLVPQNSALTWTLKQVQGDEYVVQIKGTML